MEDAIHVLFAAFTSCIIFDFHINNRMKTNPVIILFTFVKMTLQNQNLQKMKYRLIIPLLILSVISCNDKSKQQKENVEIPATIVWKPASDPVKFWDGYYFSDTVQAHSKQMVQWMNDYIHLLKNNPDKVQASITHSLDIAAKDSIGYATYTGLLKKYIYDPNSPYRNDDWYIFVLEHVQASDKTADGEKERAEMELQLLRKNKVGEKAVGFSYTIASGATNDMYNLHAENILLFFYNPGCEMCANVMEKMKRSPVIQKALSANVLKILAVYPDDDLSLWQSHRKEFPAEWINSYDRHQDILKKKLYDLKAIPSLYLLDKEKKVILKDANFVEVEKSLFGKYPLLMQ